VVPLAELATGAAGALRAELRPTHAALGAAGARADDWSAIATAAMRRAAEDRSPTPSPGAAPAPSGEGMDQGGPHGGGLDGGSNHGGDEPSGGGPTGGEPPPEPGFDWDAMPELELGPGGVGATPVSPHEDAS
jgi:hypothetical protein